MGLKVFISLLILSSLMVSIKSYRRKKHTPLQEFEESNVIFKWKNLDFEFPSELDRKKAIKNGSFVFGNAVPIDVAVYYSKEKYSHTYFYNDEIRYIKNRKDSRRVFVTVPRFIEGIPATLTTISNKISDTGPLLKPYPPNSVQLPTNDGWDCNNGIVSVFRVAIDECDRLWVLDTGRVDTKQYCPPKLLIYNLMSDTLIHSYTFPESQYKSGVSLFITPIVDVRSNPQEKDFTCKNTKVYIADVTGFGIIVYDLLNNKSWRIQNKLFYPNPDYGTFTIAGESFDLMDGIFGMEVTPKRHRGERFLYFHALASGVENVVPLHILDNNTIWDENTENSPRSFITIGSRGIQSAAEAMDSKGNLYFGVMNPIAIAYWNIHKPYSLNSFENLAQNNETLQFVSGMKVVKNRRGQEELWASTCRFQKIMTGTKNPNEINFRIHKYNLGYAKIGL